MKKFDQEILENGIGDCFKACVATIFQRPMDEVPHFVRRSGDDWFADFEKWLRDQYQMSALLVRLDDFEHGAVTSFPEGLFILSGVSPRSTQEDDAERYHCVAMAGNESGWELFHDPFPSREGVTTCRSLLVFTKIMELA